ncbi:MAG: hypothetical protein RL096_1036, partial [Actinomycetota bacterium]
MSTAEVVEMFQEVRDCRIHRLL